MSNGDRITSPHFRPELKKVTPGYQDRLEALEGLYDWGRALRGERILERLNRGPIYRATRYARETFGGLLPTAPPNTGGRLIKGPTPGQILDTDYMKRMRRFEPAWKPHTPKAPEARARTRSVLEVGPHTPLDPKVHWVFPPTVITRSGAGRDRWRVPTGRRDPYPREVARMPTGERQAWLRSYYRANPVAASAARAEARTIIDWAHKHLR